MDIVLSAHFDIAKPVPFIEFSSGKMKGLIDNFAGIFVAWEAHKKTGAPLYLTNFEETGFKGARDVVRHSSLIKARGGVRFRGLPRPLITQQDKLNGERLGTPQQSAYRPQRQIQTLMIVVDTTRDAGKFPAYIGNVYNFDIIPLKKKFAKDIFFMPGLFEETEDETWVYGHEMKLSTFYFGVPISHEKDYHHTNNSVSEALLNKTAANLVRVIRFLQKK